MAHFMFSNIRIAGMAAAVPETVVKVDDFATQYGSDYTEKFKASTGITQFRKTSKHQTASDLCYVAAEKILTEKAIDRSEIGALVFVAHSTDYRRPATACVLHKRLGLDKSCAAFDVGLGCSAFVYGLQIAASLMQSSDMTKALVLVGETLTKITHPKDRSVSMLFGDGGSAVLLEKTDTPSVIQGILKSDGEGYRAIIAPAGGFRNMDAPHDEFVAEDGSVRTLYNTVMQGENVFAFTISDVPRTIKEFLNTSQTVIDDYDCLAFHQANQFIHKMLAKKLKADSKKMPISLDRYGNTSAAAIPLTLCDAYGSCADAKDVNTLCCGFGVGLSWGCASFSFNTDDVFPIIETSDYYKEGVINSLC